MARSSPKALLPNEADFRLVAESIPHIVWVSEPDGATGSFNLIGRRYLGQPVGVACSWLASVHPDDAGDARLAWNAAVQTGTPVRLDCRIRRDDGEFRLATFRSMPVRAPDGSVVRWICTLVDVEESDRREKLLRSAQTDQAESLALLNSIYATAPVGLGFIDRDYRIVLMNEALAETNGPLAAADQLGMSVGEVVPDLWERLKPALDRVLRDGLPIIDSEVVGKTAADPDRTHRWLTSYYPVHVEDEVVGIGCVAIDVTDRVHAEPIREAAAKLLRETVQESYRLEREANQRLRTLDASKNDFLMAVSHELRTPLTAILGFALTLQRESGVDERLRDDSVDRIAVNAKRLARMVDSLLDLGRLTRGLIEPKRETIDVGILLARMAQEVDMTGRPLTVEGHGVEARLDVPMVERIIENLLVNVVRHTPVGTSARLTGRYFESGVLIELEDNGRGIPDDVKQSIFRAFDRANDGLDHSPGLGVGLSLVSKFASLHGGRVWVEDVAGGGARFCVYLPSPPSQNAP